MDRVHLLLLYDICLLTLSSLSPLKFDHENDQQKYNNNDQYADAHYNHWLLCYG